MKKLISIALLLTLMLCCFTGCGDEDNSSQNNSYYSPSTNTSSPSNASSPTNASYSETSTNGTVNIPGNSTAPTADINATTISRPTGKITNNTEISYLNSYLSSTMDFTYGIRQCYSDICAVNTEVYPKTKTAPDTISFADVVEANNMNDICQNVQYNNQTYRLVWDKDSNYCYFINDNNDTLITMSGKEKKLSNFVKLTDDNGSPSKTVMIKSLFE